MIVGGVILGLIVLTLLVVIHELGHAIVALRNGVGVEEFGVGFPPKIWSCKLKNGTLLSINALPIGGFVRLQGETESSKNKGDYGSANFWQKTKILLAGVLANWLLAIILLTTLAFIGMPRALENQFSVANDTTTIYQPVSIISVLDDKPASKIGIQPGDQIKKFKDNQITTVDQLIGLIQSSSGEKVGIEYLRNGEIKLAEVNIVADDDGKGLFGVGLSQNEYMRSTWSAPIVGVVTTAQFTYETLRGFGSMVGNLVSGMIMQFSDDENARTEAQANLTSASDSVAGPLGILGVIFPAAGKAGITQTIFLTAIISLSLAVVNILPIPALDGGRWLVMTIFKISKRKLTKELEEKIQMIGFAFIMALVILVTIADIAKIIS